MLSTTEQENNKRIAKNTIYLYIRMFLTMIVSLYTSRIVLRVLGDSDYGLYNVIGGIILYGIGASSGYCCGHIAIV